MQRSLGEDEQARKSFEQSLQLNSSQFNAWLGLGLIAQKEGSLDEAVTDLSHSISLHPTAEACLELGRALVQAGRIPEAREVYRQALDISAGLTEAQPAADALQQQRP